MFGSIKYSIVAGIAAICLAAGPVAAQEGGPRKPAPEPADKAKPAPRLADGKIDFGGKGVWAPVWVLDWADAKWAEKSQDVPMNDAALKLYKERRGNDSRDDPEAFCLPPGVPRYTGTPYPFQLIQLPDRVVILYEGASHMYRTVFMNKPHTPEADLNPTWMGESVGHWDGNDTLVVDTVGFNGRTWLDYNGHPTSEKLHVIEKFTRPDSLTMRYEATIEDPTFYTKPWTTSFFVKFRPGWELQEYVCLENNKDLSHIGATVPK